MKYLLILLSLCLSVTVYAQQAATGFELGVARLSDGDHAYVGPSWTYHFEYKADSFLAFFGQAGMAQAQGDEREFKQTHFGGGLKFHLLPVLDIKLGVATTIASIEKNHSEKTYNEMGPLIGAAVSIPIGVFRVGTTMTIIRTNELHSTALRMAFLIVF